MKNTLKWIFAGIMILGMITIVVMSLFNGTYFMVRSVWAILVNIYVWRKGWYDKLLPWHLQRYPETKYKTVEIKTRGNNKTKAN